MYTLQTEKYNVQTGIYEKYQKIQIKDIRAASLALSYCTRNQNILSYYKYTITENNGPIKVEHFNMHIDLLNYVQVLADQAINKHYTPKEGLTGLMCFELDQIAASITI